MTVNYDDYSTEVLVECLPENRPLYKDSGLWTIFEDDFESPIIEQTCNAPRICFVAVCVAR